MGCDCGKPKCDGHCGVSPAVLQINNPSECVLFHRVEVPASMGDSKTNPPKNGAYKNVLLYYEADQTSWLYSSDGIPTRLTNGLTDYEDAINLPQINGVTLLGNKSLGDLGITDAIDDSIAEEKAEREAADEALGDEIDTINDELLSRAVVFDTVADMKVATNLTDGSYAQTLGGTAVNDGDYAIFEIKSTGTPDGKNVYAVANNLYAHRVFTDFVTTDVEFAAAINDDKPYSSYVCKDFTINSSITLTSASQCLFKSFSNATITLNDDLFTWSTPTAYHAIPNFVNCTFIGNGHNICDVNSYVLGGKFVNCNFIDCGIVSNGTFAQSLRFINCRIENLENHYFIHAKQVYDTHFISCQCEGENKAALVNAYTTDTNIQTTNKLDFVDCIFESQTSNIVIMHDGDVAFTNCYTELNSENMVEVLPTNRTTQPIIDVRWTNCRIQPTVGKYATHIDSSYEGSIWASFVCLNSSMNVGSLVNTNNLHYIKIENTVSTSNGQIVPSYESSKIYTAKNSVADFSTAGHCIVKKFPALIVFDSSDGGWHSNLYFVSLCYNNTPRVTCLTDPTKTPTITYDSNTGYCDVTLHAARGSYNNCCAVLLDGITNNLIRNDYYRTTDGYTA